MAKVKVLKVSEKSVEALAMLKANGPMVAHQIKAAGLDVNSSQLGVLIRDGKATAKQVEITVMTPVKRIVNLYTFVEDYVFDTENEKESE